MGGSAFSLASSSGEAWNETEVNDGSSTTEQGETGFSSSSGGTSGTLQPSSSTSDTTGAEFGCSKVDFLVVVDHSRSMWDEAGRLEASFPGFLDTLAEGPNALTDVHILVTDVDAWVFETCDMSCECNDAGICGSSEPVECNLPCTSTVSCTVANTWHECGVTTPLDACESVLGAGITHPRGQGATNADCEFSSGARYIDVTEPDIGAAFECAAGVGTASWVLEERTLEAAIRAVEPDSEAAGCNEGWLRDDAILVVVFVTDERDWTGQTGIGVELALVAAKNDNHESIVVLGLLGDDDLRDGVCVHNPSPGDATPYPGAAVEKGVRQLLEQFEGQALRGSICEPTYDEFFADAIPIVEATCDAFVPPG